jgi:uncharacterized membrane protein HdeD (DUF308 family)
MERKMTTANPSLFEMQRAISETLRAHWRLFLAQGVIMIILGILAVAAPVWATFAVDIYVGWLFLISGVIGLVAMFSARNFPGFLWTFATALLFVVVGGLLLSKPAEGALSLTIVLTAFFIVEGIFQAVAALIYRDGMPGTWGWMLVSGLADLVLAAVIISGWPGSVAWVLGLLVGINLLTSGWAIVMVALGARDLVQPSTEPIAKH